MKQLKSTPIPPERAGGLGGGRSVYETLIFFKEGSITVDNEDLYFKYIKL